MHSSSYRADIDGLRSVAVLSVILFHVGIAGFSGGYIGVDVFFVISGYLITGIIRGEVDRGAFSVLNFYERRVRRIVPVLLLVVAVTLLTFYWLKMSPHDFAELGASAAAAVFFVPNYFFMNSLSGYFAAAAENQPLLHTWSLGVEEQFYILFPLLVIFLGKNPRQLLLGMMLTLFVLSLVYSQWMLNVDPTNAFFGFPSRAWELMAGALLTFIPKDIEVSRRLSRLSSVAGLAAIFIGVFVYGNETAFPGVAALLPVLGSALVLLGGRRDDAQLWVLSNRVSVAVGKISYSMYLWHWPVIVAIKHYRGNDAFALEHQLLAIVGTLALSWASWRLVEQPLRKKTVLGQRKNLFAVAMTCMLCLAVAGLTVSSLQGLPGRFSEEINRLSNRDYWRNPDIETCLFRSDSSERYQNAVNFDEFCVIGNAEVSPTFLLWGDSHAEAIRGALSLAGDNVGASGVFAGYAACPPMLGVQRLERSKRHNCMEFNDHVIRLLESSNIERVFLHARWAFNYYGSRYGDESGKSAVIAPAGVHGNPGYFEEKLEETVRTLQGMGIDVVIIAGVPEVGVNVPQALVRASLRNQPSAAMALVSTEDYFGRYEKVLQHFDALSKEYAVNVLRPDLIMCDAQHCRVSDDLGRPLYTDAHHLSWVGANALAPLFEDALMP